MTANGDCAPPPSPPPIVGSDLEIVEQVTAALGLCPSGDYRDGIERP